MYGTVLPATGVGALAALAAPSGLRTLILVFGFVAVAIGVTSLVISGVASYRGRANRA